MILVGVLTLPALELYKVRGGVFKHIPGLKIEPFSRELYQIFKSYL